MLLARTPCWLLASRPETMPEWFSAAPWTSSATPSLTLLCRRPHLDPSGKYQRSPQPPAKSEDLVFILWMLSCFFMFLSNKHCCVDSCQAWEDRQHGAGWSSVPLGVQGGRSPEGGRCDASPCWRVLPPCSLHRHWPCGELWAHMFVSAWVVGCSPSLTHTYVPNRRSTASSSRCCLRAAGFPLMETTFSWSSWGSIPSLGPTSRRTVSWRGHDHELQSWYCHVNVFF